MGLDITAYTRMTKIDAVFDRDGEPIDPVTREPLDWRAHLVVGVNNNYPERAEGIEDGAVYTFVDSFGFRAGSYSGYSRFREQLATLVDYPKTTNLDEPFDRVFPRSAAAFRGEGVTLPFYELLNFSDCEGVIGPVVAKKLAQDFADHQAKADAHEDEYFRERYGNWRKAFDMATDGGAVDFH